MRSIVLGVWGLSDAPLHRADAGLRVCGIRFGIEGSGFGKTHSGIMCCAKMLPILVRGSLQQQGGGLVAYGLVVLGSGGLGVRWSWGLRAIVLRAPEHRLRG